MKGNGFQRAVRSLLALALLLSATTAMSIAQERTPSPAPAFEYYRVETRILEDGTSIDAVLINGPPTPPLGYERPTVDPSELAPEASATLPVPGYDWSYGCSATSAAMIAAYYDRTTFPDMYTGPTNGGVMPVDNSTWGHTSYTRCDGPGTVNVGEIPIGATRNGIDGRATAGHVDDYWIGYFCPGPDPWTASGPEHTADSLGDYMETNKWLVPASGTNIDGGTTFFYDTTGAVTPATALAAAGPPYSYDGGLGIKQFYESRGYTVSAAYNQYRQGRGSNPALGFTYAQYKAEIDAGRPVMIHVEGHTMVGTGYDDSSGDVLYVNDTWDYVTNTYTMTWGGSYTGMAHVGVTIVQLATPTAVDLVSFSAETAQGSNAVLLNWETATELDNVGFNLYRAQAADGARVQLNGALIPAQHPGSPLGATYSFIDDAVEANTTYYYWLEDMNAQGMTTLHGPAAVTVTLRWRLRPIRPHPSLRPVLENLQ